MKTTETRRHRQLLSAVVSLCLCGVLTSACSDPKQTATQIASIAAEGALFTEFVQQGHSTPMYARTHPDYLKRLAESAFKQAQSGGPTELKQQAQRLKDAVDRLTNASRDPASLSALHEEFEDIARSAGQIGESI